jgi:hypothetical protein
LVGVTIRLCDKPTLRQHSWSNAMDAMICSVAVSKIRMLVPQPRLADAGVTVAMLVTTTAVGRRRLP